MWTLKALSAVIDSVFRVLIKLAQGLYELISRSDELCDDIIINNK